MTITESSRQDKELTLRSNLTMVRHGKVIVRVQHRTHLDSHQKQNLIELSTKRLCEGFLSLVQQRFVARSEFTPSKAAAAFARNDIPMQITTKSVEDPPMTDVQPARQPLWS